MDTSPLFTRKHIAISIGILLVVALATGFIGYQLQVNQIQQQLESSDFVVTQVDLLNATGNEVFIEGKLEVSDSDRELPSGLEVESIFIMLSNNSNELASFTYPFSRTSIGKSETFVVGIPIDETSPSTQTKNILTNILTTTYFSLDLQGNIKYQYRGIAGELKFKNILQFDLDQEPLDLLLNKIKLPNEVSNSAFINFSIFNPFTSSIDISGSSIITLQSTDVANLSINPITLSHGWTNVSAPISLMVNQPNLFSYYFVNISSPIILKTALKLGIDELQINVEPELAIESGGLELDFLLTGVNTYILNSTTGQIYTNVNGTLISELPLTLNISAMEGIITNKGAEVGYFKWDGNNSIILGTTEGVDISYLRINSTLDKWSSISSELGFKNLKIDLNILNKQYTYNIYS